MHSVSVSSHVLGTLISQCELRVDRPQMNPAPDWLTLFLITLCLTSEWSISVSSLQRAPELTDNRHKCAQMKLPHYVCLMLLSIQRSLPCPSFFSLHPSSVSPPGSWAYFSASHIVSLEHTHLHLSSGAVNLYHPVPRGSSVTTDIKAGFPFSKQHIQYIFSIYGWSISVDIVWGRQGLMM